MSIANVATLGLGAIAVVGLVACQQGDIRKSSQMSVKEFPVRVDQAVEVDGRSIVVTLSYENISSQPVLIKEGLWGVAAANRPKKVYDLSEPEYSVSLNGKPLNYIGPIVDYSGSLSRKSFVSFGPGEKSVRMNEISKAFEFVPGRHDYEIVHRHFTYEESTGQVVEHVSRSVIFTYSKMPD